MDIALSDTQVLIRDTVRGFLNARVTSVRVRELESEGTYDTVVWDFLVANGFLALAVPETLGGDGGDFVDLGIVLEEITRRPSTVPYMETMTCLITLARAGQSDATAELVSGVLGGQAVVVPAILEQNDSYDTFQLEVAGGRVTGEKRFVDYGQLATHHLVAANEDGSQNLYVVSAREAGVQARSHLSISSVPQATISYASAPAIKVGGPESVEMLRRLGRVLCAIQCLGNAQRALDLTLTYVQERVQFGVPLASFQAVQHQIADMATMVTSTRFLAYEALWNLDRGVATNSGIAIAKALASKTVTDVTLTAHQLHGGMGITEEYDLHFFSMRGKERSLAWGSYKECLQFLSDDIETPDPHLVTVGESQGRQRVPVRS